jgi:hypothetical protein
MHVKVQYNNKSANLDLYVIRKGGPPLFGREWLHHFQLNWKEIKSLQISQETESSNSKIVKVAEEYEKGIRNYTTCLLATNICFEMALHV